ncbi:MAG: kelch repeat-containing protein [Byssovorax sp.]
MKRDALIAAALVASLWPAAARATAPMSRVRWLHTATTLPDGRVLVAGGLPDSAVTTAELYDPRADTWTDTKTPMLDARYWHHAAALCDGRVLLAGKSDAGSRTAEIYDPTKDAFFSAPNTKYSHIYGAQVTLPDCSVALIGGYSGNYWIDVYDPKAGAFKTGGAQMHAERFFHTATVLPDGRVLIAGGGVDASGTWYTTAAVDLYDPVARTMTKVRSMKHARRGHSATLLPDGRVLVAGGTFGGDSNGADGGQQLDSTEIYDVTTDTWAAGPKLLTARTMHAAVLLPSGVVLMLGGLDATTSATRKVEGWKDGAFHDAPPLEADRFLFASAVLHDGGILLTGGVHQATAEIYRTADLGAACASGVTCASGFCVGGLCCDEACATGCRRCDIPGREGTCGTPCADEGHALGCPGGGDACASASCMKRSCSPFTCEAASGACRGACQSVDDCAPGYACDERGACVEPPDVTDGETSCAVERAGGGGGEAVGVMGAIGALLARRRRKRAPEQRGSARRRGG